MKKINSEVLSTIASGLTASFLEKVIDLIVSKNIIVNKIIIKKFFDFFDLFDSNLFIEDRSLETLIFFIKILLKNKIKNINIETEFLLSISLEQGQYYNEVCEIIDNIDFELSNEEICIVDEFISNKLKYITFMEKLPNLQDMLLDLQTGNFNSLDDFFIQTVQPILTEANNELKRIEKINKFSQKDFNLSKESLGNVINETIEFKKKPAAFVKTGIQALNELLSFGKGWEASRVYLMLGISGQFKSGFLLNAILWFQKWNQDIKCLDSSKKPAGLYITLENDINETVERIIDIKIPFDEEDKPLDISEYDSEDLTKHLNEEEKFNDDKIQLFFKYRPTRSINADNIVTMIEELSELGFEVRFLVVDYVLRMESVSKEAEERFRLAAIVDQLSVIAKEYKFPILSASQLNREAMRRLEEMLLQGKANIAKNLNSSNIGESIGIIQNADVVLIGQPE